MEPQKMPDLQTSNHPFYVVAKQAEEYINAGHTVFQKFTCANCLTRQTMPVPNKFWLEGKCEECGHITNIEKMGCNYLLIMGEKLPDSVLQKLAES